MYIFNSKVLCEEYPCGSLSLSCHCNVIVNDVTTTEIQNGDGNFVTIFMCSIAIINKYRRSIAYLSL